MTTHYLIKDEDRFIELCAGMKNRHESFVDTLPIIKNLLTKFFIAGLDDIIYKYTEPVIAMSKYLDRFGCVVEEFHVNV
jgi:hypothetical protein